MTKRLKYAIAFGAATALIIITAALLRGWWRGDAVPAIVSFFYKNSVRKQYEETFSEINPQLKNLGISFNYNTPDYHYCSNGQYANFSQTVLCIIGYRSLVDPALKNNADKWKQNADAFESALIADRWEKSIHSSKEPLSDLYDSADREFVDHWYFKTNGNIECDLRFSNNPKRVGRQLSSISESCRREVNILGGSKY